MAREEPVGVDELREKRRVVADLIESKSEEFMALQQTVEAHKRAMNQLNTDVGALKAKKAMLDELLGEDKKAEPNEDEDKDS